ncbi:MAG: aminodeoxychorismate synthase component I [Steroidobacteraceae bacterium]
MEPTVRSFSAECDPLRLIARYPDCYPGLLESGSRHQATVTAAAPATEDSRFDILPMASGASLRLTREGVLLGEAFARGQGFFDALEGWCREVRMDASRDGDEAYRAGAPRLPFRGGWIVYLGYELAGEVEPGLRLPRSTDALEALAIRAPAAWVRDRHSGQGWLIAEPGQEHLLERFESHLAQAPAQASAIAAAESPGLMLREEPEGDFIRRVERALEYIAAGDIYQANLSRGWTGTADRNLDPVELYRRLRAANPGPFCALLRAGDFAVVSSSPERLMMSDGHQVFTRPIAGTRPRGATPEADAALVRQLLDNEKEKAEHVMLIDLERNDLGRVCAGGSVRVDEFMSVESYAHVHHIVSNVTGTLRPGISPVQVLRAVFPGGTITGCPKFRCMQIIAELEGVGRGAYTGSLGYINTDGSADFNILIRTMSVNGTRLDFRAGAGIVADSDPQRELAETRAKAEGLRRAVAAT